METITEENHIPVYDLINYMNGIETDDLFEKYKSHIQECDICQESTSYVIKNRSHPFYIRTSNGSEIIPTQFHVTANLSGKHIGWLKYCFLKHHNNVNIVAGEANVRVYTKEIGARINHILGDLDYELEHEDKMKVVCGPIITINDDFNGEDRSEGSIFSSIAKDKNFELYFSNKRQKDHFRIGGRNIDIYVESPHDVCEDERESFLYTHNPLVSGRYVAKFNNILKSAHVWKSIDPRNDFIFLNMSELKRLKNVVEEEKLDYNDLTKSDLVKIISNNSSQIYQ